MAGNPNKGKIVNFAEKGKRFDNRGLLDFRKIEVQEKVVNKAEGSARVKIGNTEVIAGVKMGIQEPYTDSPDAGTMMVTVEMTPLSSSEFESGPPDARTIEMARVVDRGIRESEVIDFKQLCIEKGEKVWTVFIDIFTLNDDGNLLDAAALAATSALRNAVFPKMKDGKVLFGEFTTKKLPVKKDLPITVTLYKLGKEFIIDPSIQEEKAADARLSVAIVQGNIHAMQKGGTEILTIDEVNKVIEIAEEKVKEVKKLIK